MGPGLVSQGKKGKIYYHYSNQGLTKLKKPVKQIDSGNPTNLLMFKQAPGHCHNT
jgi:hypothetical protein